MDINICLLMVMLLDNSSLADTDFAITKRKCQQIRVTIGKCLEFLLLNTGTAVFLYNKNYSDKNIKNTVRNNCLVVHKHLNYIDYCS